MHLIAGDCTHKEQVFAMIVFVNENEIEITFNYCHITQ